VHKAKSPDDGRLRVNKSSHRQTAIGARRELELMPLGTKREGQKTHMKISQMI